MSSRLKHTIHMHYAEEGVIKQCMLLSLISRDPGTDKVLHRPILRESLETLET